MIKNNYDDFNFNEKPIIQNTYSNIIINNINTSGENLANINKNKQKVNKYKVNTEIYENFLIKCCQASEISYDDLELFVEKYKFINI